MKNNERKEMIKNIKATINNIGEVVIEDVDIAELISLKAELDKCIVNRVNYDAIRKIGRVYLDKENSDLFIDTITCNGIIISNGMDEDADLNQFALINYEFLSDEILIKIIDYLIQIIKI